MLKNLLPIQPQGSVWAYRSQQALLLARHAVAFALPKGRTAAYLVNKALTAARRAMDLTDEQAREDTPSEQDYVRAHWLLGAAFCVKGVTSDADHHLSEALARCRRINLVHLEAAILLELARLRAMTGDQVEGLRLAQEALIITERSSYVLQGADVHLFLAQLVLDDQDKETALAHLRRAYQLATCDGPPDYAYKVAYEEAGSRLKHLQESL